MSLFNLKKTRKQGSTLPACSCGDNCNLKQADSVSGEIKNIKVLGAGCESCHKQYVNVKQATQNLNLNVAVEYITDMQKVMVYGAMSMPAIVVNDKVISMGKVLKVKEVEKCLSSKT